MDDMLQILALIRAELISLSEEKNQDYCLSVFSGEDGNKSYMFSFLDGTATRNRQLSEGEFLHVKNLINYCNLTEITDKKNVLDEIRVNAEDYYGLLCKAYECETNELLKIKIFSLLYYLLDKKRLIEIADEAAIAKMPKLLNKVIRSINLGMFSRYGY